MRHFVSQQIPLLVCQSYAKNAGLYGERIGALNLVATHAGSSPGGAERLRSQLLILQRQEISNPPTFGARIVGMILNDEAMFGEWKRDIGTMAGRIIAMRERLHDLLVNELKTPAPGPNGWDHVVKQIGVRPLSLRLLPLMPCAVETDLCFSPSLSPLSGTLATHRCSPLPASPVRPSPLLLLSASRPPADFIPPPPRAAPQCKAMVERGHVYMTGNGRISMAGINDGNVEYVAQCFDKAVRGTL